MEPESSQPLWLLKRSPVTLTLVALTLLVHVIPGASSQLHFSVSRAASGECWRTVTGHFAHWSADHLIWDLIIFLVLGILCESRSRKLMVLTLSISALLIPLAFSLWMDLDTYAGLSGLNAALFALLGTSLLVERCREGDWFRAFLCFLLLAGLIGKNVWEFATGDFLFVSGDSGRIVPVPLAHLVGAVVGSVVGFLSTVNKVKEEAHRTGAPLKALLSLKRSGLARA